MIERGEIRMSFLKNDMALDIKSDKESIGD